MFCKRLVLGWFGYAVLSAAAADAPQVVRCEPRPGSQDVPPHTRFIRVEFDQDMVVGSHSWVGGGATFPTVRGQPYWESPRVAVLPIALKPEHSYQLWVNNARFTGFRSRAGKPVETFPIEFKTGAVGRTPPLDDVRRQENRDATKLLRKYVEDFYSYRDLRKVDWDAHFKTNTGMLDNAAGPSAWAARAGQVLAVAEDLHIWLKADEHTYPSHRRSVKPNFDVQMVARQVPNWKQYSNQVAAGRFKDDIGYLLIATWDRSVAGQVRRAIDALKDLQDCKAIIIDVRPNSGGDERLAREFASFFVREPVVYAQQVVRDPSAAGGFTPPQKRTIEPTTEPRMRYRGQVAVLMGPANMSSCEAFLLMMRQVPDCTLIGERSYGSSGNPKPYGLPNGVVVHLPSWKAMTAQGEVFEGQGLRPDQRVAGPGTGATSDPVLQAALKHLRRE